MLKQVIASLLVSACVPISCATPDQAPPHGPSEARLRLRAHEYQRMFLENKHDAAYDMLAREWWDDTAADRKEWRESGRAWNQAVGVRDGEIIEVLIRGHDARVRWQLTSDEMIGEYTEFWRFEYGDWYFVPIFLEDFSTESEHETDPA